ncbi:MAG TPA: hypothetical protein VM936_18780 [Pyrinomonadaceae bacterium]|nr:hypothetical protein [Pyrinomonadaceae bacterium]
MRGKLLTASAALALACALGACTDSKNTREVSTASPTPAAQAASAESPAATTPAPAATPTPEATPMPEPPAADDARAAVARVYKGAVTPDERAVWTAVGDFNGDGSEDLVARVRAAPSRVDELNDDLANWIVADPQKVRRPDPRKFDPHQGVQKLEPLAERPRVAAADPLLVVIHGFKERGWRSPDASPTYLLRDAAGADLRAESRRDAKLTTLGQNPPRLMGDVIRETLDGRQGFLYWNGATYGWFHPENDK